MSKKESLKGGEESGKSDLLDRLPNTEFAVQITKEVRKIDKKLVKITKYEEMEKMKKMLNNEMRELIGRKSELLSQRKMYMKIVNMYLKDKDLPAPVPMKVEPEKAQVEDPSVFLSSFFAIGSILENKNSLTENPFVSSDLISAEQQTAILELYLKIVGVNIDQETSISIERESNQILIKKLLEKSKDELEVSNPSGLSYEDANALIRKVGKSSTICDVKISRAKAVQIEPEAPVVEEAKPEPVPEVVPAAPEPIPAPVEEPKATTNWAAIGDDEEEEEEKEYTSESQVQHVQQEVEDEQVEQVEEAEEEEEDFQVAKDKKDLRKEKEDERFYHGRRGGNGYRGRRGYRGFRGERRGEFRGARSSRRYGPREGRVPHY